MVEAGRNLRVLYLINSLSISGGAERAIESLAAPLREHGIEMTVAYLFEREPSLRGRLEDQGVEVIGPCAARPWPASVLSFTQAIRRVRPDVVHTTLFEADQVGRVAARICRVPVVTSLVNPSYSKASQATPSVRRWRLQAVRLVDMLTARLNAAFHAITWSVAGEAAQALHIRPSLVTVIPRGRATAVFHPDGDRRHAARQCLGLRDTDHLVVSVGRLEFQKAHDVTLRATAEARETVEHIRLVIAGRDGSQSDALRAQVRSLGLSEVVSLLGPRDDVPDLLRAADVFVAASRWEGLGSAVVEAMATGTPLVLSDIPPHREIAGTTAMYFPSEDATDLATTLVRMLRNPAEALLYANTALARHRYLFAPGSVAPAMAAFYNTTAKT